MKKTKISLYIGSDNATNKISTEYLNRCSEILNLWFFAYTINQNIGLWRGKKEDSLKIEIFTESEKDINKLYGICEELKQELKQESVLYTKEEINYIIK